MITNLFESDTLISEPTLSNEPTPASTVKKQPNLQSRFANYWEKLSLKRKASILALAIGVVPIAIVGGIAQRITTQSMMYQIVRDQESRTFDIRQKVDLFINQVVNDAETIASSPLIADPEISAATPIEHKIQLLNNSVDAREGRYDSIAVFDMDGNLVFQSKSSQPLNPEENYSTHEYFQRAISTQAIAIDSPIIDKSSSANNSLEVAAPIKETGTGKILGAVRVEMPLSSLDEVFQYVQAQGWEHRLIDSNRQIFVSDEAEFIGTKAGTDLVDLPQLEARMNNQIENLDKESAQLASDLGASQVMYDRDDKEKVLVSLAPINNIEGIREPGWQIALSRPVEEVFAPLDQLRLTLFLGISGAALVLGALATMLAHRAIRPIVAAAGAVEQIGQGHLNTKLDVQGKDELARLGKNINKMAEKLRLLVEHKAAEAERSELLKDLTNKLAKANSSEAVFQIAVEEILPLLQVDRAIVYVLESGQGKIVAEALADDWSSFLSTEKVQLEYANEYLANNQFGQVHAISNIYQAGLKTNHLRQLEALKVQAELSAPFVVGEEFHGLLIVHQCERPRKWRRAEIDFFVQLTSQVMLSLERTNLLKQQQAAKEQLQQRALELLTEVEPISQGDLTIRATVTEDEIGTLADSYNSTVENLRQIVTQVQKSVTQLATATGNNEGFAHALSDRAYQQSEAIAAALDQIQAMAESIQAVADNAEEAETTFQEVSRTVAIGDEAMDRTVEGIFAIRETVAETAKKVKRLGESSQKISKVVNLISSFATQTNLLALNASLEASRAGQEGQNFAFVAEEVRALAQQSAAATTEIEKLVASIQLDTKEVATAMEQGTERVVIGTKLVEETRQSLNLIASASDQVSSRIEKIAQATVEQSQASQTITQTIAEVAKMATTTSIDATQVSASTKELLKVAEELQASVSQFKLN